VTDDEYRILYEQDKDPSALMGALHRCQYDELPPSDWLVEAIEIALRPLAHRRPGRGRRSPHEIFRQRTSDWIRWMIVGELRKKGVPARESFQAAADYFANASMDANPGGSADAIRRSYRRMQRYYKQAPVRSKNGG
jgi:hypothetical protein